MLAWALLLAAGLPAIGAPSPDPAALAASFATALDADSQDALNAIAAGNSTDDTAWPDALRLVASLDDLRVRAAVDASRLEGETLVIETDLSGTGVTPGGIK